MYAGARARVKFDQLEAGLDKKLKEQAELARAQTEYRSIAYSNTQITALNGFEGLERW